MKRSVRLCSLLGIVLMAAGGVMAPVVAQTAQRNIMEEIKKRGELIVGMEAQYPPFEYFDKGKIIGYDVDIIEIIAKDLGVKAKLVDTAWAGIIPALYERKFDCIISAMTITPERAQKVDFSMPYAEATNVALVRKDDGSIKTAKDLAGKRVGSQLGSAGEKATKGFEEKLKKETGKGFAEIKLYDHFTEGYVDLDNKRIDAVINSLPPLLVLMKEKAGRYRYVDGVQTEKAYFGGAFRKEDRALRDLVDKKMRELKASGKLTELQKKWFGFTMETPMEVPTYK